MLWFSNRDGLKAVAQSGGAQQDAYAMFFTQDAWDRFRLTKEEFALVKEAEEKKDKDEAQGRRRQGQEGRGEGRRRSRTWSSTSTASSIRKARLTIHSSSLGDALVSKDGETLYYLARFEKGMNLWSTNLRTKETKMLVALNANGGSMEWDKDQKNIFLLGRRRHLEDRSGHRQARDRQHQRRNGRRTPRPSAQPCSTTCGGGRSDTFYTAGYHGIDWVAHQAGLREVPAAHRQQLRVRRDARRDAGRAEHQPQRRHATRRQSPTDDATAALGVFYDQTYTGAGVKVDEVIKDGPLDKAGMTVKPGMIIESIDGETIAADKDLAAVPQPQGRQDDVLLVVADGDKKTEVVVKPITLAEENRLLYARWVRRNQEEVDRLSNGQLGYIHVPGMNDGAYRTTFEEVMGKYATRKGIVVDTRFNGGGDLVADLAMFLSGKKFFDYTTDTRSNGFEPNFRWTKPSVSLANEANYSDGHCYAYTYKALKLGKLVGMPVPGTCTFAGWESLQDGTSAGACPASA